MFPHCAADFNQQQQNRLITAACHVPVRPLSLTGYVHTALAQNNNSSLGSISGHGKISKQLILGSNTAQITRIGFQNFAYFEDARCCRLKIRNDLITSYFDLMIQKGVCNTHMHAHTCMYTHMHRHTLLKNSNNKTTTTTK